MLGIVVLGAALTGYFITDMSWLERGVTFIAALLLVAPGFNSGLIGLLLTAPVIIRQVVSRRHRAGKPGIANGISS